MNTSGESILLDRAIQLGRERRYKEAIPILQEIVSSENYHTEAILYLGRSYHAVGDFAQAIEALRQFVAVYPESSAGHFFLGRSFLSAGAFRAAEKHLRYALELNPGFTQSLVLLGYTQLKLKNTDDASDLLGRAVEAEPDNTSIYSGYLSALFVNGIKHFKMGSYDYAVEVFEFLVSRGFDHILLHLYMGMIYRNLQNLPSALHSYEEALRLSPRDELILYRTALLNIRLGNEKRGNYLLNLMKEYYPSSSLPDTDETDHALALQYLQRGDYEKALSHGLVLLKQNNDNVPVRLIVAECCRELNHLDWAVNHYTRAVERDPYNVHAHFGLAMIWWQTKEYQKLQSQLDLILKIDPDNESARYYRVLSRGHLDIEPAVYIDELTRAIHSFGPDLHLLQALADTYLRDGAYEYAEKWYRKVLSISPAEPDILKSLIMLSDHIDIPDLDVFYNDFIAVNPRDISINKRFIQYLYHKGEYKKVITRIESILPFMEDTHWLNRIRAISYRKISRFRHAAVIYRQLLRENPEKEEFLRPLVYCLQKSGQHDHAAHLLAGALDHLSNPSSELFLIFGVLQFNRNNMKAALRAFRDARDMNPDDWRAYHNMGEIYRKQGMEDYSQHFFLKAESLRSSDPVR